MSSHPTRPSQLRVEDIFDRLEQELQVSLAETIIPEFPLKHSDNNLSDKVDYLLCSSDRSRVFLVEPKTDLASHRTLQAAYLDQLHDSATKRGMRASLEKVSVEELSESTVDIVYIQPQHSNEPNRIDFQTFARYVARYDDPISRRFCQSLEHWQTPVEALQG